MRRVRVRAAMATTLAVTLALAALAALAPAARAADIAGTPKVIDGDSLEVAGRRIRLYGIDAPELAQTCRWGDKTIPCGEISKTALMDLTAGAQVTCTPQKAAAAAGDGDDDGDILAVCRAGGFDLGRNMVHTGWAMAAPGTGSAYVPIEAAARKAGRGLWRGTFEPPWEWRRSQR